MEEPSASSQSIMGQFQPTDKTHSEILSVLGAAWDCPGKNLSSCNKCSFFKIRSNERHLAFTSRFVGILFVMPICTTCNTSELGDSLLKGAQEADV